MVQSNITDSKSPGADKVTDNSEATTIIYVNEDFMVAVSISVDCGISKDTGDFSSSRKWWLCGAYTILRDARVGVKLH